MGLLQLVNASKNVGFDYESFIESVRPHPYLYDRNSPGFKDKVMKDGRWALIAASNGITSKDHFIVDNWGVYRQMALFGRMCRAIT